MRQIILESGGLGARLTPGAPEANGQVYWVEVAIYGVSLGEGDVPVFDSEPLLVGAVKWDGCSNWHAEPEMVHCWHGCTRSDLTDLGAILGLAYDAAGELMPATWIGDQ